MKVLVAEDDDHIRNGLIEILENEGYQAIPARDGPSALALFASQSPDFICLDIMMPKISGYDVCREIRKRGSTIPIIFITAKTEEVDRVLGLELGADDYILKPFGVREVLARIRAVTRRCLQTRAAAVAGKEGGELTSKPFRLGDLEILPSELRARRGKDTIELSLRDLKILELFHQNSGKVLDRYAIFSQVWGWDHIPNSRTLDQHISQLRKRIERDPKHPAIIQTVHGVGYRYDE
ncbi:MAG: response regulator transcription factor [Candidatus Sumerlaeota bacterium]|nr:response regulator transcription factor [Candidatus Sumerlaeota bacterium]